MESRMSDKGALGWFANESLMHQKRNESFKCKKHVGKELITSVFFVSLMNWNSQFIDF